MKKLKVIKPERELLFTDQPYIDQQTKAIENTLPFMEAIYEEYNKLVPNVPELDTQSFQLIFIDLDAFVQHLKDYWYENNFGENHRNLGVTPSKGFKMVDDQVPPFQPFENAVMAYKDLFDGNNIYEAYQKYSVPDAFEIVDNGLIASPSYLDKVTENAKFYLEHDEEFKLRDILSSLADNFIALNELVHPSQLNLHPNQTFEAIETNFNVLHDVFDVKRKRFEGEKELEFKPKLQFYRNFKNSLLQLGKI